MSEPDCTPGAWTTAPLSVLCEKLVDGSHLPPAKQATGRPMLSAKNIENGHITLDGRLIALDAFETEDARTKVRPGDVLLTIVGTIGRTAVVPESFGPVTLQRSVAVLKLREMEPRFCMYQLQSPAIQHRLEQDARGTAQKGVYLKTLGRIELRVAPQPEQRRIVAKIEELFSNLDAGVAALLRVRANLKRYRAAVLKAAVEGRLTAAWRERNPTPPDQTGAALLERILAERRAKWEQDQLRKFKEAGKTPPKGWNGNYDAPRLPSTLGRAPIPPTWHWTSVDQLTEDSAVGLDRGRAQQNSEPAGAPYLKMNNITMDGRVVFDGLVYVPVSAEEQIRFSVKQGDLLFNTRNSVELVGKVGYVGTSVPNLVYNNNLMRLRFPEGVLSAFVCHAMCSTDFRHRMELVKKATTNVAAVYAKDLFPLAVPLPPLAEQAEIVAEVDRRLFVVEAVEAEVEHGLQRASRLRQAILKRAFEGRLVAQDTNHSVYLSPARTHGCQKTQIAG